MFLRIMHYRFKASIKAALSSSEAILLGTIIFVAVKTVPFKESKEYRLRKY